MYHLGAEMLIVEEAVQVWGVTDDRSWRSDEYPLLFDLKIRPKEAFFAVAEAATPEAPVP